MPRKIFSTLLYAGIVLLVVMWFASGPPPATSARGGGSAPVESRDDAQPLAERRETPRSEDAATRAVFVEPPVPATPDAAPDISLAHQNPPGVLEVLVLLDREPLAGARVRLLGGSVMREDVETAIEVTPQIATDARGIARFDGLDGDRHLIVEARSEPDVVATVQTLLHENEPTWRIVMQFGRGGVEGHVFALDGSAQAGVAVTLESIPRTGGPGWHIAVRTGDDGSYRIAGLAPGVASVFADDPAGGVERRIDVQLADGEWKRVDFGSDRRALRWSGRVKLASGANVDGFESLIVREATRGEQIQVACAASGEFAAELPPGEYIASAWTGAGQKQLGVITLTDRDVAQDLVLPGIQLRGRIEYSGTSQDKAQPASSVQVWVERVGGKRSMARRSDDGRYVIACLERGEYTLTSWPNPLLGAGVTGMRVQLDGATDDLVVDLTITDP